MTKNLIRVLIPIVLLVFVLLAAQGLFCLLISGADPLFATVSAGGVSCEAYKQTGAVGLRCQKGDGLGKVTKSAPRPSDPPPEKSA